MNKCLLLCLISFVFSAKNISTNGLKFIKELENFNLTAYYDYENVLKIGFGTTNNHYSVTKTEIKEGMTITQEQAEKWLKDSLDIIYTPLVNKYDDTYEWTQNEFDALISFAYNVGNIDVLLSANGSSTRKAIANKMKEFILVKGNKIPELITRRNMEYNLFLKK